jgi:hypothetical protein
MNGQLALFDESPSSDDETKVDKISESQRHVLRGLFRQLGITTARDQFEVVESTTGQRISSVNELTAANAALLIFLLPERIKSLTRPNTGNAWDDREEETWIDKL